VTAIDRVQYYGTQQTLPNPIPPATDAVFMNYDNMGRVKERVSRLKADANGNPWFYEMFDYNQAGQLIKTTDGKGNVSINDYDDRGLLVRESLPDPDGNGSQFPLVITHQYDNMARLTATDRGFGRVTRYEYNNRSWLTKITQPDPDGVAGPATSPITLVGYDLRGDQTSITDAMNRTTTLSYDNEQRLLFQNDPDPDGAGPLVAAITGWGYNANNQVTYINEAPAGITSSFQYDALGRLTSTVEPDPDGTGPLASPTTTYVYGTQGLQSIVDPLSHVTSYVRDARGRIKEMTDTAGSLTSYKYDFYDNLRLVTAADRDGAGPMDAPVTEFTYDPYGRLKSKDELATDALNTSRHAVTQYTYDAASNLTSLTDPNLNTTLYAYDNLNRMISDTDSRDNPRTYTYDVAGNMTRSVDRNGRVIEYEYDKLDRQTQEKWQSVNYIPSVTAETLADGHKVNETQVVGWTVPNSLNNRTGTFTLTVGSSTTAPIDWAADAVTIQAALAALPNIGLGNVSVIESNPFDFSRSFTLVFRGARAGQNMPQTTINLSNFTTVPANLSISTSAQTTTQGTLIAEKQKIAINNGPGTTAGVWYLSYAGQVSNPLSPFATGQQVAAELNQFAGIENVSVSTSSGYFEVTFGGTQDSTDMQQIMADVSGLYKTSSVIHRIETQTNAVGELTSTTDTDLVNNKTQSLSYVRDNLGRATNINSTYDAWNIPTVSLVQKFDAEGNRSELSATYGSYTDFKNNYTYDKLHRLTEVTQVGQAGATWITPKRVTQSFNALGQRTGIERFESITTANPVANTVFTYDTANRLSGIAHKQGTTNLDTYSYTYDPLSRLKTVTSTAEGLTAYGYDSQSQLTSADHVNYPDEPFGYDANGNRNTTGYTVSDDNRTMAGPGWTYAY
ncbi:MAG: RHS repeat protein, partial [Planctomycetales bacterium]|nr:RHS repeat protein [Planctomycetales bacterium]